MMSEEGVVWENEGEIYSYLWKATGSYAQRFRASLIKIENTSVWRDETVREKKKKQEIEVTLVHSAVRPVPSHHIHISHVLNNFLKNLCMRASSLLQCIPTRQTIKAGSFFADTRKKNLWRTTTVSGPTICPLSRKILIKS